MRIDVTLAVEGKVLRHIVALQHYTYGFQDSETLDRRTLSLIVNHATTRVVDLKIAEGGSGASPVTAEITPAAKSMNPRR